MEIGAGGRSPFSPRVRGLAGGTGRRSLTLSAVKKSHSKLASGRGPPGDIILKSATTILESHGQPLPVLVTETLTFANPKDVSVRLSANGWCWLVCGRKLLVWPHREGRPAACRELTLPQTDLAHKADLVCLFYAEGNQMPSCVGVSPEGVVRFWWSVAHESSYMDETAALQGQECDSLTDATPAGCVLATTTCTIVLVQTAHTDGRASVTARSLRAPSGWLGGIGRRVSLLIFGSMPAQVVETKLVGVSVVEWAEEEDEEACVAVAVAAGTALQLWALGGGGGGERLLREFCLRRPLLDAYIQHQLFPPSDAGALEVAVLDLRPSGGGLLLLTAAGNPARAPDMRYALVQVSLAESPVSRVTSLVALPRLAVQRDDADAEPTSLRFLNVAERAYLYTRRQLIILSSTVPNDKPDYLEVGAEGARLLGAELCQGVPLFFTSNHGVLAALPADFASNDVSVCESPLGSPRTTDMYDGHLSLYEIDPHEASTISTDAQGKLKTAFLYHVRRDAIACRAILEELFPAAGRGRGRSGDSSPPPPPPPPRRAPLARLHPHSAGDEHDERDVDAPLDRTVARIAQEMLDDVPAGDPRWNTFVSGGEGSGGADGGSVNIPLGSSSALQILAQLRDKQKALNLFIDFLRATGLWHRLGYISREAAYLPRSAGSGVVSSRSLLGQLLERLAAAAALRRMQQAAHAHILDTAIHQVIHGSGGVECAELEQAVARGVLSPSDVFYKRVSRVERALHAVTRWCSEQASSDAAPDSLATLLLNANRVLLGALLEVHKCRAQNCAALELPTLTSANPADAITWTGALGSDSLLTALAAQQKLTVVQGARVCAEATLRGQLYEQAASLAELLLTDAAYLARAAAPAARRAYDALRRDLIQPFMEDEQYERAAVLAEKFRDFDSLILMCSASGDRDKLCAYMDKYANEGLVERTFARLVEREGGAGAARALRWLGVRHGGRLRAWLRAAPERRALLLLHELQAERYARAATAAADLAAAEHSSLARMETMASLSKLCAVACGAGGGGSGGGEEAARAEEALRASSRHLALCEQHAALPRDLLLRHGLPAAADMRVFTPQDLIQMYATDNVGLTEHDFKKALDLADFIEDEEERVAMRLKVWCAAVLQDEWAEYSADAPLDAVQDKVFFKLVDLAELHGCDLEEVLPAPDELLEAESLAELAASPAFQFVLKYGYQHVRRSRRRRRSSTTVPAAASHTGAGLLVAN